MDKGESTEDDESTTDAAEYFLAGDSTALTAYTHSLIMYKPGRNMSWLIVGASLFGSDVGSSSMVGLAGTGCSSGIAVAAYNWQAPYVLGMLALVMGPVYRSAGICTTPEFIRKRYDSRVALFVTIIQILFNGIAQLAVTLLCDTPQCSSNQCPNQCSNQCSFHCSLRCSLQLFLHELCALRSLNVPFALIAWFTIQHAHAVGLL